MLGLPSLHTLDHAQGARIWFAAEATDMRCGFDRLAERVRAVIGQDPLSGHLFLFRSRRGIDSRFCYGSKTDLFCGTRRANRGDPGQFNQHLSSARRGSPALSHAAVDESAPDENKRVIRLAARPMEDPSPGSNRNLQRSVHQ
jgi:hypothetical protein